MGWWGATFDLLQLAKDLGALLVFTLFLMVVLGAMYSRRIRDYLRGQHDAAKQTRDLYLSAKDPSDPRDERIITLSELRDKIQETQVTVNSRCGSANCPVVPVVQQWMVHTEETIQRAISDMDKAHGEFNDTAKGLFDRFSQWSDKVGSEMVAAIRNGARK